MLGNLLLLHIAFINFFQGKVIIFLSWVLFQLGKIYFCQLAAAKDTEDSKIIGFDSFVEGFKSSNRMLLFKVFIFLDLFCTEQYLPKIFFLFLWLLNLWLLILLVFFFDILVYFAEFFLEETFAMERCSEEGLVVGYCVFTEVFRILGTVVSLRPC